MVFRIRTYVYIYIDCRYVRTYVITLRGYGYLQPGALFEFFGTGSTVAHNLSTAHHELGNAVRFEYKVKAEVWRLRSLMKSDSPQYQSLQTPDKVTGFNSSGQRMMVIGHVYKYFDETRGTICPDLTFACARMWMLRLVCLLAPHAEMDDDRVVNLQRFCTTHFNRMRLHIADALSSEAADRQLIRRILTQSELGGPKRFPFIQGMRYPSYISGDSHSVISRDIRMSARSDVPVARRPVGVLSGDP